MADEQKPKTVKVEALQIHSYNGKEYQVGDTYEIAADLADSVAAQGKAVRTDRAEVAKQQADAAAKQRAEKGDTSVQPMTTGDLSGKPKK